MLCCNGITSGNLFSSGSKDRLIVSLITVCLKINNFNSAVSMFLYLITHSSPICSSFYELYLLVMLPASHYCGRKYQRSITKQQFYTLMCGEVSVSIYFHRHLHKGMYGPRMWLQGLFWAQLALIGKSISCEWIPTEVIEYNRRTTQTAGLLLKSHYCHHCFSQYTITTQQHDCK